MKVKKYLNQIYDLNHKIKTRKEQLDELYQLMAGIKGISYDKDRVSTSAAGDRMADMLIRHMEMAESLASLIDYYIKVKDDIIREIQDMPDEKYSMILDYRYVKFYRFEKIACEMNYDYNYVKSLHSKALRCFIETYPEKELSLHDLTDI